VIQDPCPGNDAPSDLLILPGGDYIWGHFVNAVIPAPFTTGGNNVLCQPLVSFLPCVAVLVE
jgi:hypothetical protein